MCLKVSSAKCGSCWCVQGCSRQLSIGVSDHNNAWELDSLTVSLHNPNGRHLPAVRAVQGDCQWPLKYGGIPTDYISPEFIETEGFLNCI